MAKQKVEIEGGERGELESRLLKWAKTLSVGV